MKLRVDLDRGARSIGPERAAEGVEPFALALRARAVTGGQRLAKDLVYLSMVLAALPVTLLEAAFRAGSTVMIEARPT